MVDFGKPSGPEQAGVRPAVLLQDDDLLSALTTVIVVPITTNRKRLNLPATLLLSAGEAGLPQQSVLLGYQVQVRGKSRLISRLGELSRERLEEVEDKILEALGM